MTTTISANPDFSDLDLANSYAEQALAEWPANSNNNLCGMDDWAGCPNTVKYEPADYQPSDFCFSQTSVDQHHQQQYDSNSHEIADHSHYYPPALGNVSPAHSTLSASSSASGTAAASLKPGREETRALISTSERRRRREAANRRERKRMSNINEGYSQLKAMLTSRGVCKGKELSKIEALRMANEYIVFLKKQLGEE